MSAPVVYRWDDASAPTLDYSLGSFGRLCKACLGTGYGVKPGAGWTVPYEAGANQQTVVVRQGGGNQFYMRLRDNNFFSGSLKMVDGYEVMTGPDAGTGTFPGTPNHVSNPDQIVGRYDLDATPLRWVIAADDRTVYFFVKNAAQTRYLPFFFGDTYSHKVGDPYRTIISFVTGAALGMQYAVTTGSELVFARTPDGVTPRPAAGLGGEGAAPVDTGFGPGILGTIPYPSTIDNGLWLSRLRLGIPSLSTPRGRLRGLWQWLHNTASVADLETFAGAGRLAGRTFMIVRDVEGGAKPDGVLAIETSDTWDTSA